MGIMVCTRAIRLATTLTVLSLIAACTGIDTSKDPRSDRPFATTHYADGDEAFAAENYPAAWRLWILDADNGDADAMYGLGLLLDRGLGADEDLATAAEWYSPAANQDHSDATFSLGLLHKAGRGVARDPAMARALFERAARRGHGSAQNSLGVAFFHGVGGARDIERAFFWLELATRNGLVTARQNRDFVAAQLPAQRRTALVR